MNEAIGLITRERDAARAFAARWSARAAKLQEAIDLLAAAQGDDAGLVLPRETVEPIAPPPPPPGHQSAIGVALAHFMVAPSPVSDPPPAAAVAAAVAEAPADEPDVFGVYLGGRFIALDEREALLVQAMIGEDGRPQGVVSMSCLRDAIGLRSDPPVYDAMRSAKKQIEPAGWTIENRRGEGYELVECLAAEPEAAAEPASYEPGGLRFGDALVPFEGVDLEIVTKLLNDGPRVKADDLAGLTGGSKFKLNRAIDGIAAKIAPHGWTVVNHRGLSFELCAVE